MSRGHPSLLRPRDPVELRVRDAVLAEEEAQLGGMLLDVTHGVQHQFQITDGPPLPLLPRELIGVARPFAGQGIDGALALLLGVGEIGEQFIFRVGPFGRFILGVECWRRKRRWEE